MSEESRHYTAQKGHYKMKLIRDNIALDKDFPFQISEVVLNHKNSRPDTFHWHSYFEITYVQEGQGNYSVNGQEYMMKPGDIIILIMWKPWLEADGRRYEASGNDFSRNLWQKAQCF